MMQNNRGRFAALDISSISHLRKTREGPYTLIVCLCDIRLFSIEQTLFFIHSKSEVHDRLILIKLCKKIHP